MQEKFDISAKLSDIKVKANELTLVDLPTKLQSLKTQLSEDATIHTTSDILFFENGARRSAYGAQSAGAVVDIATEADIARTIKRATSNAVKFIAQSGGHGITSGLANISSEEVIINLRAMNNVSVDLAKGTATIGAGALTGEVMEAAHAGLPRK